MVCTSEGVFTACTCTEGDPIGSGDSNTVASGTGVIAATGGTAETTRDAGLAGTAGMVVAAGSGGSGGMAGSPNMAEDAGLTQGDGSVATAGTSGTTETAGAGGTAGAAGTTSDLDLDPFSFFVVSYEAMQRLSNSPNGFGGDLRYGEATGIAGADKICTEVAEYSMPGAAQKGWRAFLSATTGGPDGGPILAIDRVGPAPWYHRLRRTIALTTSDLANTRPLNADPEIANDLPNEYGVPNHAPDGTRVDNHHVLTGSNEQGRLAESNSAVTCQDWTSSVGADGRPRCGMSWPRGGGGWPGGGGGASHWISGFTAPGCAAYVEIIETGAGDPSTQGVGTGGGYGAIYCFALVP